MRLEKEMKPRDNRDTGTEPIKAKYDEDHSDNSEYSIGVDHEDFENEMEDLDLKDLRKTLLRNRSIMLLAFLLASAGGALFMYRGIYQVKHQMEDFFERRAIALVSAIESSFRDYDNAALLTHDRCRRARNTSRKEFHEFYKYLLAGGMEFQSVQCSPNVTWEDRYRYEKESLKYYGQEYPEANYGGFIGFVPDEENGGLKVVPSPQLPVYFPVYYAEPVMPNAPALGLDMYSYPSQKNEIDLAVTTRQVVLSKRLQVVQEIEDGAYSILIYHPGIYLESSPDEFPLDLGIILVRIPSLLSRVALIQEDSLAVYLFDTTVFNTGGTPEYLGGMEYHVVKEDKVAEQIRHTAYFQIPEIEIDDLRKSFADDQKVYEKNLPIASGTWQVVVTPIDTTYEPDYRFVIFGGVMILISGLGLIIFLHVNNNRLTQIYTAKAQAEAERDIVSSLFPKNIRERLMEDAELRRLERFKKAKLLKWAAPTTESPGKGGDFHKSLSPGFTTDGLIDRNLAPSARLTSEGLFGSKPIAEFHPHVTIMYAGLTGFTAWSSVREPSQVFTLLEVVYHSFDMIAKRRRIFKVETVGDKYVAAAGVPTDNSQHAVFMAKFAAECLHSLPTILQELETTLGPDTGDMSLRIGLHSGAVTAGVLRGDKGRFQLFGDTFNFALQMQNTGKDNCIHVSQETADLLTASGKSRCLTRRDTDDKAYIKGRGHFTTYWLKVSGNSGSMTTGSQRSSNTPRQWKKLGTNEGQKHKAKVDRLVSWNVAELANLLKKVVAVRVSRSKSVKKLQMSWPTTTSEDILTFENKIPLDSVLDVIYLPDIDPLMMITNIRAQDIDLGSDVMECLSKFVSEISKRYRPNPFHNFEHASHVAMSVTKQLTRIANPKGLVQNEEDLQKSEELKRAKILHQHTFGITSDPMTQFTAFVAALIHDLDHPGYPNTTLAKVDPEMNTRYKGKSLAEQHSLDLGWELLMKPEYEALRKCIFGDSQDEKAHFRQLLVNMVMATDVMDKELGQQRKNRWNQAFSEDAKAEAGSESESKSVITDRNRKATIVIEHLIQASDVSHTMQHWHIYQKWNERLFMEMYHAYQQGHLDKDPSEGWYSGEIGFLQFYVLPLASKLDTCGVFGVSSEEFRFYAMENLKAWETRGKDLVKEYVENYQKSTLASGGVAPGECIVGINEDGEIDSDSLGIAEDLELLPV